MSTVAEFGSTRAQTEAGIAHYERLLMHRPDLASAHFNLALLYRRQRRYADALAAYEEAARLGIRDVQEVWSNMGVVYSELHDAARAAEMYERALKIDPAYVPALFNLASLYEEAGETQRAIDLYRQILTTDPGHYESLSRLAYAKRVTAADQSLLDDLRLAIRQSEGQLSTETLYFALAKALDDLGLYDDAYEACAAGNELGKRRLPAYDRQATEQAFASLKDVCNADWISRADCGASASPIFICGMFRSGSTLVEQILASHPAITAGGEQDLLPSLITEELAPYPQRLAGVSPEILRYLGREYLGRLRDLFPDADAITDKRPDNFLHLGLIKALFPAARIIYTVRNPLDNCLSIWFQQLGGSLSYSTSLEDTLHYYRQHERLMAHWRACVPGGFFTVDYDELVRSPEPLLRRLMDYLGVPWDRRCLHFQEARNLVKTASALQVRESLHRRSSGRWRKYARFLRHLEPQLPNLSAAARHVIAD